jgi:hypothetical protein
VAVRYTVPNEILDRAIGDELLVHRFDTDEVFVLNGDAKLVFEAVKASGSREDVCEFVAARVFGDTSELYNAVDRALGGMLEQGLLLKTESEGA